MIGGMSECPMSMWENQIDKNNTLLTQRDDINMGRKKSFIKRKFKRSKDKI